MLLNYKKEEEKKKFFTEVLCKLEKEFSVKELAMLFAKIEIPLNIIKLKIPLLQEEEEFNVNSCLDPLFNKEKKKPIIKFINTENEYYNLSHYECEEKNKEEKKINRKKLRVATTPSEINFDRLKNNYYLTKNNIEVTKTKHYNCLNYLDKARNKINTNKSLTLNLKEEIKIPYIKLINVEQKKETEKIKEYECMIRTNTAIPNILKTGLKRRHKLNTFDSDFFNKTTCFKKEW